MPQPVHRTEGWPTTNMKVLLSILIFKVLIVTLQRRLQSFLPHGALPQLKASENSGSSILGVYRLLPLCLKKVWEKQGHPILIYLVTNKTQYFSGLPTIADFSSFTCRYWNAQFPLNAGGFRSLSQKGR